MIFTSLHAARVGDRRFGSHDDDGQVVDLLGKAQDFQAAPLGHAHVGQNDIVALLLQALGGFLTVSHLSDDVTSFDERLHHTASQYIIVFND